MNTNKPENKKATETTERESSASSSVIGCDADNKRYACGMCGILTDKHGNPILNPSSDFDPNDCELLYCVDCDNEERNRQNMMQVTRDMAIDAGDPSLEGQWF